ncbi:hypothetical protein IWW37_001201 [Coemansia sp. RSA 2050]|nr:hypothetical protein IWW37_001201 [Coemansia sp. RSA 2050]KAJ2728934.1 hypothetical protein IW152_005807 [Coemansia sp. BCRC 34962]
MKFSTRDDQPTPLPLGHKGAPRASDSAMSLPRSNGPSESESNDDEDDSDQFFEASEGLKSATKAAGSRASTATSMSAVSSPIFFHSPSPAPSSAATTSSSRLRASVIAGVDPDDSLQTGVDLAMRAMWLFMDSDFEQVEILLNKKRHSLLYASEGYAAIQYLRAMMTFTQEAVSSAQKAAESTINLTAYYRKPRGVSALLSGPASRSCSPQVSQDNGSARPPHLQSHHVSSFPLRSSEKEASNESSATSHKSGSHHRSWLHLDSPRLSLRTKKGKHKPVAETGIASTPPGSYTSMDAATFPDDKQELDPDILDAKFGDLQVADNGSEEGMACQSDSGAEEKLDKPSYRSWASGLTGMADSLIGIVRAGTQAVGISKPDWHLLKTMSPTQRHAELVHAEAHLIRAVLNVASGDGIMAVLKEGWHVRSAYAIYRGCYAYIQDVYAEGGTVDDHFVSGTYLGMGTFNLILSMLPAKLLRFIELVGFTTDRKLGLELLALAAGWRADASISHLMNPPPTLSNGSNGTGRAKLGNGDKARIHPCGMGLRSEFCSIVLQVYHVFLCNDLFLGYPNLPLVDAVLRRATENHPRGLIFMYFDGRLLMSCMRLDDAIGRFSELVHQGKGAVKDMHLGKEVRIESTPDSMAETLLIDELSALDPDSAPFDDAASAQQKADGVAAASAVPSANEWRQLQYLGYWERSLCLMSLGRWMEAAKGFNTLRKENNWSKGVYIYALAACIWEHYLTLCDDGTAVTDLTSASKEEGRLPGIVSTLMEMVPTLKRKLAGKSIPIEKFVIRKANKFRQQGGFLLRPGLELLHVWNLYSKMPHTRLLTLRDEIDAEIGRLGDKQEYRHEFYYDDLAVLLLTKGCVLRELAYPTFISTLSSTATTTAQHRFALESVPSLPELALLATDSFLRLLRLVPLIERDHYLGVVARFHLGNLYLSAHGASSQLRQTDWARAHWKCILGGKPLASPPYLSTDEYQAHVEQTSGLKPNSSKEPGAVAAPGCAVEEDILQSSGHPSLAFYNKSSVLAADWSYSPPYWSDSKKYSLENMIEVRTFNADNRLKESLASE